MRTETRRPLPTDQVVWRRSAALAVMVSPTLACLAYGGFPLATGDPRSRGTVLAVGGVASLVLAISYGNLRPDARPSWGGALRAYGGLVPYAYALYVMLGVGGVMLYGLTSYFSWPNLLGGVFWVAVGYRILLGFGRLTEAKEDEKKALAGP